MEEQVSNGEGLFFSQNPNPMWIYDPENLRILEANQAALKQYGYTREEMTSLTLKDLRPESEVSKLISEVNRRVQTLNNSGPWIHMNRENEPFFVNIVSYPIQWNAKMCKLVVASDITEQVQANKKLEESRQELHLSRERYDMVARVSRDAIFDWDIRSNEMHWNNSFKTAFVHDYQDDKYTLEDWLASIHSDDVQRIHQSLLQALKTPTVSEWEKECRFVRADGSYAVVLVRSSILRDGQDQAIRMIGTLEDITERKQAEEKLQDAEQRLQDIIEFSTNMFYVHTIDHELTYVSPQSRQFLGCDPAEAKRQWMEFVTDHPVNQKGVGYVERAIKTCRPQPPYELQLRKKSGEIVWVMVYEAPVVRGGEAVAIVGSLTDITEQKRAESKLRDSLKEKEILLAEIHHRVKNNLAVISGMLQLQAFDEVDETLNSKLMDSVVRIKTMATIHEQLYQSGSFSNLNYSESLRKLAQSIIGVIQKKTHIELCFNLEPVKLNVNQALPCSLIVNEVVTNIIKHAFKGAGSGKITFTLSERDNRVELTIADNGVGLPKDFNISEGKTLGIHLIQVLSMQLDATYSYTSEGNGSIFSIQFVRSEIKGVSSAIRDIPD